MSLHLITGYAGKEHITSADQGSYNAAMLGNGEFVLERGNKFQASIISNNKVRVLDGDLMMQGRHIRLVENTYDELNFENGVQGYKRNDLIVARYTKDSTTGIEKVDFTVIKGTPAAEKALDPIYQKGNIITENALVNDMLLYRVPFDGLNMQDLVPLFTTLPTIESRIEAIDVKVEEVVNNFKANDLLDTMEEIEANTSEGKFAGARAVNSLKVSLANSITGLNNSLNTFTDSGKVEQLHVGADGKPYIKYKVGADTVDLKLGSGLKIVNCGTVSASWSNLGDSGTYYLDVNTVLSSNKLKRTDVSVNNFKFTIVSISGAFWGTQSNWKTCNISYGYNSSSGVVQFTRTTNTGDTSMQLNPTIQVSLLFSS